MLNIFTQDAPQRAMAFLTQQASYIETEVYKVRYPAIRYPELVPVDTTANPWSPSVTYFSVDAVGQAQWFNGRAQDVAHTELLREKFQTTVSMAAIGYRYDLEELGQAQLLGQNLGSDKADAARFAAESFIDNVALFGDASKGFTGLVNNAAVAVVAAPAGASTYADWARKTPDEVLADVNSLLIGIFTGSNTVEMADTLLLPYTQLLQISTRRIDATNQTTILEWIEKNNVYTKETGQQLTVRGVRGLETAGGSGASRAVAYRRSPQVVKMHMPMPYRFLPVWQTGPIMFEVPGIFRLGGVDVRLPGAMRYLDGV